MTLEIHQQCCVLISKSFLYSYLSFCFLIFVYSVFVRSSMTVTICAYLDCCLSCLAPPVTRLKYTMKLAGTTLLHECKYVLLELGYVVLWNIKHLLPFLPCPIALVTRLKYTRKLVGTTLVHDCKYVLSELGYIVFWNIKHLLPFLPCPIRLVTWLKYTMKLVDTTLLHKCKYLLLGEGVDLPLVSVTRCLK